jgi:nicotinamidase-related amidase
MPPATLCSSERCGVLVIDPQERLMGRMKRCDALERGITGFLTAARLLDVPIAATEQVPEKLGGTLAAIRDLVGEPIPKSDFSCFAVFEQIQNQWSASNSASRGTQSGDSDREVPDVSEIILIGVESHVCVWQTAADLRAAGLEVIVPVDAIASQRAVDHKAAVAQMASRGCRITTTESLLFEWLRTSNHPTFRDVSRIVKSMHRADG